MTDTMPGQDDYITKAIEAAATALLWQASDATENGNGFPLTDRSGTLEGETQYIGQVTGQVPYLSEAVTAFVRDSWRLLLRGRVTASQCGHDIILTANGCGAGFWDRRLNMPADDDVAYAAWQDTRRFAYPRSRELWEAWLAEHRPAGRPRTVGDALTQATRGYSFDAEFALDDDGDVTWLMVENTVLVNVPCPDCGGTLTADVTGHKPGCPHGNYSDERPSDG